MRGWDGVSGSPCLACLATEGCGTYGLLAGVHCMHAAAEPGTGNEWHGQWHGQWHGHDGHWQVHDYFAYDLIGTMVDQAVLTSLLQVGRAR